MEEQLILGVMMVFLGTVLLVVSGALATCATLMVCQANPEMPVPWVLGASLQKPRKTRAMYGLAGAVGALGALQLFDVLGYWAFLTMVGAWAVSFAVQFRHNHVAERR